MTETQDFIEVLEGAHPALIGTLLLRARGKVVPEEERVRRAAIEPYRDGWAEEAAAVISAGVAVREKRTALDAVTVRVEAAKSTAARLDELQRAADDAAQDAAREHAASFMSVKKGAEAARKADQKARKAVEALERAKQEVSPEALAAATHGDEILTQAQAELRTAEADLALAFRAYAERKAELLHGHIALIGMMILRPLVEEMAADHDAVRFLTGGELADWKDVRMMARDGVLIAPPGYPSKSMRQSKLDTLRRAAGVGPDWTFRVAAEDRVQTAVAPLLPPRPPSWTGIEV